MPWELTLSLGSDHPKLLQNYASDLLAPSLHSTLLLPYDLLIKLFVLLTTLPLLTNTCLTPLNDPSL